MARRKTFSVRIRQEVYDRAKAVLPVEMSWSGMLEERLLAEVALLEHCQHDVLHCIRCGVNIDRSARSGAA